MDLEEPNLNDKRGFHQNLIHTSTDKSPFYPTLKDPIDEKKIKVRLVWLPHTAVSNVAKNLGFLVVITDSPPLSLSRVVVRVMRVAALGG